MSHEIYGVDLDKPFGIRDVTGALVNCFAEAHAEDTGLGSDSAMNASYCEEIVRKAFSDVGGDFDSPTKESLQNAISNLSEFSENFRDPEIVEKHAKQIMILVNGL